MAKVILLSGSPNKKGNTVQVLEKMAEAIRQIGVEAEVVSIAKMNITDCMNVSKGGYPDDFQTIIDKIKEADGLIVGGPVYWGTMRAELMTAMQRIAMASIKEDNFLAGKVGGVIAIARRGGLTSALQEAMMFFLYHDMIIPGSTYWNIVFGKLPGEALKDKEGMGTVIHFAENVANIILKLKA